MNLESMRKNYIDQGFNFTLVMSMTDNEVQQSINIDDYADFIRFMNLMGRKYGI